MLDFRGITGESSLSDLFEIACYAATSLPHTIRVAVFAGREQMKPDSFFEAVARNRDLDLRGFTDLDEAIEWLRTGEPSPTYSKSA